MKSCSMSFRSKLLKGVTLPKFVLNGEYIDEVEQSKYLGHIFTNDLTDNADIARQCRQLYAQGNMILRKFHMCTPDVKLLYFALIVPQCTHHSYGGAIDKPQSTNCIPHITIFRRYFLGYLNLKAQVCYVPM